MDRPFLTFHRFVEATPALTPADRCDLFGHMPERRQDDCWARLREQLEGRRLLDWDVIADGPAPALRARKRRTWTSSFRRLGPDRTNQGDPLLSVPPPVYVKAMIGEAVPERGIIHCPLPGHEDRTPSFRVHRESDRGWYCFGCLTGGTIIDLGRELSGIGDRGPAYLELRQWIAQRLVGAGIAA